LSFGNIVLYEHRYDCQFEIYIDWEPTKEELKRIFASGKATGIDTTMLDYIPWAEIQFTSSIEMSFVEPFGKPKLHLSDHNQKFLLFNFAQVKGTFRENFELENFPVDCQDLKLLIRLGDSAKAIWRHSGICPVNVKVETDNLSIQDYKLFDSFCCYTTTKRKHSALGKSFCEFHAVLKLQRRWEAYSIRIFLIISVVSFSSIASFLMNDKLFAERMAHITTMMLTEIAFTFITNSALPVVPYMTYMDTYVTAQFMFIFLTAVIACLPEIFPHFNDNVDSSTLAVTTLAVWVWMHIILFLHGFRCYHNEKTKLEMYKPEFPDPKITGRTHPSRNVQTVSYPGEAGFVW